MPPRFRSLERYLVASAVEAAQLETQGVEVCDTLVPGFLCQVTPADRKEMYSSRMREQQRYILFRSLLDLNSSNYQVI